MKSIYEIYMKHSHEDVSTWKNYLVAMKITWWQWFWRILNTIMCLQSN